MPTGSKPVFRTQRRKSRADSLKQPLYRSMSPYPVRIAPTFTSEITEGLAWPTWWK
jgi:hypothetical protein